MKNSIFSPSLFFFTFSIYFDREVERDEKRKKQVVFTDGVLAGCERRTWAEAEGDNMKEMGMSCWAGRAGWESV